MYTPPDSFCGWRNLTICWSTDTYMFRPLDPLLVFREFWFDTLTIHLHNNPNTYQFFRTHPYVHATKELANQMASYAETTGSIPRPNRWVLLFGERTEQFRLHGMDNNKICCDEKFRWVWRHISSVRGWGVVFCKIPLSTRPRISDPTEKDKREMFRDVQGRWVSEMACEIEEENHRRYMANMQREIASTARGRRILKDVDSIMAGKREPSV